MNINYLLHINIYDRRSLFAMYTLFFVIAFFGALIGQQSCTKAIVTMSFAITLHMSLCGVITNSINSGMLEQFIIGRYLTEFIASSIVGHCILYGIFMSFLIFLSEILIGKELISAVKSLILFSITSIPIVCIGIISFLATINHSYNRFVSMLLSIPLVIPVLLIQNLAERIDFIKIVSILVCMSIASLLSCGMMARYSFKLLA